MRTFHALINELHTLKTLYYFPFSLFPFGEEPDHDSRNISTTSSPKTKPPTPATPARPTNKTVPAEKVRGALCQEINHRLIRIQYGFTAFLWIRDFNCTKTCAHCGNYHGVCQKTYTWITYRFVFYGFYNNRVGWHWVWKGRRIADCCKCFSQWP